MLPDLHRSPIRWLGWCDRDDARVRLRFGEDADAGADGRSAEAEAPFPERRGPSGTLASVGERSLPEGGESQGAPRPFIKNASRPPDVKETPRCFGRSVETRRARCLPYLSVADPTGRSPLWTARAVFWRSIRRTREHRIAAR